jgi:hypothetical protein
MPLAAAPGVISSPEQQAAACENVVVGIPFNAMARQTRFQHRYERTQR